MKSCIWFVFLAAASSFAQTYKTCDVTMWTNETQSQSSRSNILYIVRTGKANYQIQLPDSAEQMNVGQRIDCRIQNGYMILRDTKGQVNKAQIIEAGRLQNQH